MVSLDRTHSHRLTARYAAPLTRRFRELIRGQRRPLHAGAVARTAVEELLDQAGCALIRVYFAQEASGAETFVLTAANGAGADVVSGVLLEEVYPCPPYCPPFGPFSDWQLGTSRGLSLAGRSRNHHIELAAAAELTRRFREARPFDVAGGAFLTDQVRELLAQPSCAWLRIYNGIETSGERTVVLIGADEPGNDIPDIILGQWFPFGTLGEAENELNASLSGAAAAK